MKPKKPRTPQPKMPRRPKPPAGKMAGRNPAARKGALGAASGY